VSNPQNTALPYLKVLRLIPQYPYKTVTSVLQEKLRENAYVISEYSLQRDLKDKPIRWHMLVNATCMGRQYVHVVVAPYN